MGSRSSTTGNIFEDALPVGPFAERTLGVILVQL
jgi:hypothetical protein